MTVVQCIKTIHLRNHRISVPEVCGAFLEMQLRKDRFPVEKI